MNTRSGDITIEYAFSRPACLVVCGPLRGGTTLLRLMLDGHPKMRCIGESDYLFDYLRFEENSPSYDREALATDRIFKASGLVLREDLDGVAAFWDLVGQIGHDGSVPVLMMHRNFAGIAELMDNAMILRFTRDPRDSARSAIGMGWASNVYHGVESWLTTEQSWHDFEAMGAEAQVHRLRYEDLVTAPEARLRDICDFVGLPYNADMLAYPATTTYDAPDASLAFQWKHKLSERQIALIEYRVGPLLEGSGYEPSGLPTTPPTDAERRRFALSNKWSVWSRMVKRYGVTAPVLRGIGRRLALRRLERFAQRRMDVVTIKHLK